MRWKQYIDLKRSPEADEKTAELKTLRDDAVKQLELAAERMRVGWQSSSEPMPQSLLETQLLLAEAHLEAGEAQQAADTSIMQLHVLPDAITADTFDNDHGFQPGDVDDYAIETMVSEIALALKFRVPVVALKGWNLRRPDGLSDPLLSHARTPADAVALALAGARRERAVPV